MEEVFAFITEPMFVSAVMTVTMASVVVGVLMGLVAYSVVAERRFSAWIQDRVGPNRVGIPLTNIRLLGLGQPIADGMKFLFKEQLIPGNVNAFYYLLAPCIAMIPAFLAISVVPFGSVIDLRFIGTFLQGFIEIPAETVEALKFSAVIADIDVGVLFVFAIVSISVYGVVLAGWASNSKYPFLGGIRSTAQMISYELSMGLAVVPVFLIIGHLNLMQIVLHQAENGWMIIPFGAAGDATVAPWIWVLLIPSMCFAFFTFLISVFAETNRLPFDLPEAETELVGGYHTEYGGMKFALFFLGEYAAMIVASSIMVTLFLGGWALLPFPVSWVADTPVSWLAWFNGVDAPFWFWPIHILVFIAKVACFMFLFIWVRWSLPRFRYDQLMNLGWKFFLFASLVNVLIVAAIIAYVEGGFAGPAS